MKSEPLEVDSRNLEDIERTVMEMVPHYTPEWSAKDKDDPGVALLRIFSRMTEAIVTRLNRAPQKNFVAFLDMLGIKLIPARPAVVPLTFSLAKEAEEALIIPARTQVTAGKTKKHDELPFETDEDLLAIPGSIVKAICVDPLNDAIFIAPPGFLDGTIKGEGISYTMLSAPLAGSDYIQLDHVAELNAGDYLLVGNEEYALITGLSEKIVHLRKGLERAWPAGTPVQKVTRLGLTAGWNRQEHALYLGHGDVFNVKSPAKFTVDIKLEEGTEAGVTPLDLSWEYWGEVKGEEGAKWQAFDVTDHTDGMSSSGTVNMDKTTEGEIKEKELNGVKSRWIRCIVNGPLGVEEDIKLPTLDSVEISVDSSGGDILPDLAFDNQTPLDIAKPFLPFGGEPRIYSSFAIASKEIFSKKGARITMDLDFESWNMPPGQPAAVLYSNGTDRIKVFYRGSSGGLKELEIDADTGDKFTFIYHGIPAGAKISSGSAPKALAYTAYGTSGESISVFVRSEDGRLFEWSYDGPNKMESWEDLSNGGSKIVSEPYAIISGGHPPDSMISVYVVGDNGLLYEYRRALIQSSGRWLGCKKPPGCLAGVTPFATINFEDYGDTKLAVFAVGKEGHMYMLKYTVGPDHSTDKWEDLESPSSDIVPNSRPLAAATDDYGRIIAFVKCSDNNLWKYDNTATPKWGNVSGAYQDRLPFVSGPDGKIDITNDKFDIFILGADKSLREYDNTGWDLKPVKGKLRYSPVFLDTGAKTHVFSATEDNAVVDLVIKNSTKAIDRQNEYADPSEFTVSPSIAWEYWNVNKGWAALPGIEDTTMGFLIDGTVTFDLPDDIEQAEIVGQKNYWIKARIVSGDYGKETYTYTYPDSSGVITYPTSSGSIQIDTSKERIRPPRITGIKISYVSALQLPRHCLARNNLDCLDQTEANKKDGTFYEPFVRLGDRANTLYLGFDRQFKDGPVRILFDAKELKYTEGTKPKVRWAYRGKDDWAGLDVVDDTEGFIKSDILELLMPSGFSRRSAFGESLYWIKAAHAEGVYDEAPVLGGIYPNTTWAKQAATMKEEILGSSDGTAGQAFKFLKKPVLAGEEILVRETLAEQERKALALLNDDAVREVKDADGQVIETWVKWSEVKDFFGSGPMDRHYTIDRALGTIMFGDGINGMVPPGGDNGVMADAYQAGGGLQGNVDKGEAKSLTSAVAGVDKVTNNVAADGGSDTATVDEMLVWGPAMFGYRGRAVSATDFEWLAREASAKVKKAKCLPDTNNNGLHEPGWVSLVIVPYSADAEPQPSLELRKVVCDYIEGRCSGTLLKHVHVKGPKYARVGVKAEVYVESIDVAAEADREVNRRIGEFFNPLGGGPEGKGWDFGRDVTISDVYALLEATKGVDHVENLKLIYADGESELVDVPEDWLVASGDHEIKILPRAEV